MSAQLLDGKTLSQTIRGQLKESIAELAARHGITPTLAVLRVGDDSAAAGYARAIERTCTGVGVQFQPVVLPAESDQASVVAALDRLNTDTTVHGIMILEPLPNAIDGNALVDRLNPAKDVDGVHPVNAGRLSAQRPPYFVPATPAGAMRMLEEARRAFQNADDEAQKLLQYLEPSPTPPPKPSGKKK
jgi:methylenetetrahydrofolate dehydrogenase (NADP+)/methenyltetrahydrofolate cyclohydrolase